MCTSVFCAIIDPAAGTVTYSSAGHPPPLLVTAGGSWSLLEAAQSLPLAALPAGWRRSQASASLPAGATLLLYTDGLVERRRIALDVGIQATAELVAGHAAQHPDVLADEVMAGMTPDAGFEDDVAVLIYRHPPEPLRMQVSAQDPSCLAAIRARLREWMPAAGIAGQDGIDVLIAVGEASANAFEHAPAGRHDGHEPVQISIDVGVTQAAVTVTVADTGAWRPPHDGPDTRGHGIPFMHALMDQVNIQTTEHGTTVTMTKEL